MASYATFKELYNSKEYRSPYQILSEFIKYIIISESLYSFTATDIQSYLVDEFGFNPPIAVIRTAMRNIPEVMREQQVFKASGLQGNAAFQTYRLQSEEKSKSITDSLLRFADKKGILNLHKDKLAQEFIAFVLDEDGDPLYQQIIGEFVLTNENNKATMETISAIREGSILYSGLAFNISEFGNLSQPLTLFLDTEIIFDIAGLNGILFKTLADDFLKLVDDANRGRKVITLKFFSKVADDIDQFYNKAERIVSGRGEINFTQAMKGIIEGCQSISDISDKRVELYRKLRTEHSICKDEKENYYSKSDMEYNLEGLGLESYPATDELNAEGFMFCSNINKLREGHQTSDYLSSKYLCVTDTRRVREISQAIAEAQKNEAGERFCDYAVSLSHITNLLWYKLNRGFGSTEFPKNLDVVIKARTILASYITQGIATTYKDIRHKVALGELTQEDAAVRIVALKEKTILPEELNGENIEDSLNFSEEHFTQFEETLAQHKRLLLERDKTIHELSGNVNELKGKLAQALAEGKEKQKQIDNLTDRVNTIEANENAKLKKKQKRMATLRFTWSILWKVMLVCFGVICLRSVCIFSGVDFPTWLGIVLSLLGLLIPVYQNLKKKWDEYHK